MPDSRAGHTVEDALSEQADAVGRVHKKQPGAVPSAGPEAAAPWLSLLPDLLWFGGGRMDKQLAKH